MKVIDGFKFGVGFTIGLILISATFYAILLFIVKFILEYNFK